MEDATGKPRPGPDNLVDRAMARISLLRREIDTWGSRNSQSNPGAVMELRSMRKELIAAEKELDALMRLASSVRIAAVIRKPGDL